MCREPDHAPAKETRTLASGAIEEMQPDGTWVVIYQPPKRSAWSKPPPPTDAWGREIGPDGKVRR